MYKIIVDSCCDYTPEMCKEMGIISVPLTMTLGNKDFYDNENLNLSGFMEEMKKYNGKVASAAPSPFLYQEAIAAAKDSFVITLSKKISSSYNNAVLGYEQAKEENNNVSSHVFDSQSASAGETLIAVKLHELIQSGMSKEQIIKKTNRFINNMKTYFVLENYDNLQKSGRLSKIVGSLVQTLNIKLILGDNGNGDFAYFAKCMGKEKMIHRLILLIDISGKGTLEDNIVIAHCNNPELAERLRSLITERFKFKKIYVVPTRGLSSMYADEKGIILAF